LGIVYLDRTCVLWLLLIEFGLVAYLFLDLPVHLTHLSYLYLLGFSRIIIVEFGLLAYLLFNRIRIRTVHCSFSQVIIVGW
jgi:hypothetical protein